MGPRFLGRGNNHLVHQTRRRMVPSMGPRFLGRGNGKLPKTKEICDDSLQWGRAF